MKLYSSRSPFNALHSASFGYVSLLTNLGALNSGFALGNFHCSGMRPYCTTLYQWIIVIGRVSVARRLDGTAEGSRCVRILGLFWGVLSQEQTEIPSHGRDPQTEAAADQCWYIGSVQFCEVSRQLCVTPVVAASKWVPCIYLHSFIQLPN